jgi:predicted nucleic acid-binding protein
MLDGETSEHAWHTVARLAERFRLTIYDAAYLELAQRRRLPLASLDRELRVAATALGIEVLGSASG